jgi:hypothetical protein
VYERKKDNQVFYVLPVEYNLGKLPVVPVGDTGTIPYSMRQHAAPPCGAMRRTLSPPNCRCSKIQGREPVTVAGGGISTRGP